jgi:ABC-type transport system involved in cytochrome bd biosynthesis fused ATPase/permease subunit
MFIVFLCLVPVILAHLFILWFETEFIIEYLKLFRLYKVLNVFQIFVEQEKAGSPLNFKEFLMNNYDSFFVRLITCPICLATMLSGVIAIFIGILSKEWALSLMIWFPMAYVSLFLYELMKKKMLK